MNAQPIAQPLATEHLAGRDRKGNAGVDSYHGEDQGENEIVSNRLPKRPRLRLDGLSKTERPVFLLPHLDPRGEPIEGWWTLPQTQNSATKEWESNIVSTQEMQARADRLGLTMKVLD